MSINLHPTQSKVFRETFVDNTVRFPVIVCARGWGKSFELAAGAVTSLFELFELPKSVPNKNVGIIAPTFDQAKDIYYPVLTNNFNLPSFSVKESKDLGRFVFHNNVELHLISYEAVERMRGKGYYFVGIDEPSSMRKLKENWENVIYPTISSRWSWMHAETYGARSAGRAMFAGTPKGFNFLEEAFNFQDLDKEWKGYQYDYTHSPLLDPNEIKKLMDKMDPIRFASEYLALFKESGNSVFYCFDRQTHIQTIEPPQDDEDIHCSIDFNVDKQCTGFFVVRGNQMQFFGEHKGSPDTETLAKVINQKFKNGQRKLYVYPDPSGNSRKTSAVVGTTDFSILKEAGLKLCARTSVPIVDSVNAVNRKLMTASMKTDMFFDRLGCPELIKSMERTKWFDGNKDLAVIDKTEDIEHYSDGVRYATDFLFPVREIKIGVAAGSTF